MTNENKEKIQERLIEYMCEISFKSFLETYDDIADLYDSGEINSDDIYTILDELKNKMES